MEKSKIVDGKWVRNKVIGELDGKLIGKKLAIFIVGKNNAIEKFVHKKKELAKKLGVKFLEYRFSGEEEKLENIILEKIEIVKNNVDGMIVQLPLPKGVSENKILAAIPDEIDVDVLNGNIKNILTPVAGAVVEIFEKYNIDLVDKKILIVGKGQLVGQPIFDYFQKQNLNIEIIDSKTENKEEKYKNADVIISGAGSPHLIKEYMIKDGVVLIDAGTSTANAKLVGDIDYSCEEKASLFSRVPNGVGPITVGLIFKNMFNLINSK